VLFSTIGNSVMLFLIALLFSMAFPFVSIITLTLLSFS
jgi:hypothetical protein